MQYVENFTSMQYISISVDTHAEGTLSTTVTCGVKPGCRL